MIIYSEVLMAADKGVYLYQFLFRKVGQYNYFQVGWLPGGSLVSMAYSGKEKSGLLWAVSAENDGKRHGDSKRPQKTASENASVLAIFLITVTKRPSESLKNGFF